MIVRLELLLLLSIFLCASFVFCQYGHFGPPYEYEQKNKVYYKLKKDPNQTKPTNITSNNLFGWLNKKNAIKFYLWSRQNPDLAHELKYNDVNSIKTSNFDPKKLTKIIIHGWADGSSEVQVGDWIFFMRDAYLEFADINFIAVDYAVYASFFLYLTARPELVAQRVAEMLSFMEKNGLEMGPLHIIGWSWGAHIAGMAGHRLNEKSSGGSPPVIGRITAVDPAGPTFKFVTNEYRLDKSDAKLVEIIHVNGGNFSLLGYFGLQTPLGHLDFYVNGESGTQIGCPTRRTLIYETLWCSHGRGVKYFTESIFSPLAFPACRCNSFDKYIRGECLCSTQDIVYMGEHLSLNASEGIYHLVTRPKPLYGHGVQLNISLPNAIDDRSKDTVPNEGTIRIRHKNLVKILKFNNTYNSRNYPNNDILNMSKMFVQNYLTNNNTTQE